MRLLLRRFLDLNIGRGFFYLALKFVAGLLKFPQALTDAPGEFRQFLCSEEEHDNENNEDGFRPTGHTEGEWERHNDETTTKCGSCKEKSEDFLFLRQAGFDVSENFWPSLPGDCRTDEVVRCAVAYRIETFQKGGDIALQSSGFQLVGFGEDEGKRDRATGEPVEKLQINRLRAETGVDEDKDAAEVWAVLEIPGDGLAELFPVPLRHLGISIARQVHQIPFSVDEEEVDQFRLPGSGGHFGQSLLTGEHIDQ